MQRVLGQLGVISLTLGIIALIIVPPAGASTNYQPSLAVVSQTDQTNSAKAQLARQNSAQEISEVKALDDQFSQIKTTLMYFSISTMAVVIGCIAVVAYIHFKKYQHIRKKHQKPSL